MAIQQILHARIDKGICIGWSPSSGPNEEGQVCLLHRAEVGDGVFDFGDGIGRFVAFDCGPAAVVEFGEEAEEFGEIGGAAAELDFGRAAGGRVADGVAGVDVENVWAKRFDGFDGRVAGVDQAAGVKVDAGGMRWEGPRSREREPPG